MVLFLWKKALVIGKSSISKGVYEQIANHEKAYWLHEECEKHPIRDGEFDAGDIHSAQGMELNRKAMLQKWKLFYGQIKASNQICITEGCFLLTYDRYLVNSAWSEDEIMDYYQEIIEIIKPLNPLIVFLHRPDMQSSLEKAFAARGDWWKEIVLRIPEPYGYFKTNTYTGDASIFDQIAFEQEKMEKILDGLNCDKLKIDTSDENWGSYIGEIAAKAGYKYCKEEERFVDVELYCGTYRMEGGEDLWTITCDGMKKRVYTSLFWPYMPMKYVGNEEFELISFPVKMKFQTTSNSIQFVVEGNYDWDYNGKRFIRMKK